MRMNTTVVGFLIGFTSVMVAPAFGRDVPKCTKGDFEIGLFGGSSYGLDRFRPMGGGNIAYGLSCSLFPFAEGSYLPGILRTNNAASINSPSYRQFSINMTDFHAGLHFRLPKPESRILPYGVVGLGVIRGSEGTATLYNVSQIGQVAVLHETVPSSANLAVNFGAGLRFFFNERFALRMEFKGFKPTSAPTGLDPHVFFRFAIGPVFQLK